MTKKIGGMPAGVVYVGGGLAIGIIYVVWHGRKSQNAQGQTGTGTGTGTGSPAYGAPQGPDIIPVDQGMTDKQVGDLVAAITGLNGQKSRPPRPPRPPKTPGEPNPMNWMDAEVDALAAFTGESKDQIRWELQGKNPEDGPDPDEDHPLPNDNLYGSWQGMDDWENGQPPTGGGSRGGDQEDGEHRHHGGRGGGDQGDGGGWGDGDNDQDDQGGGGRRGGGRRGGGRGRNYGG
jgi:hypothetical protein